MKIIIILISLLFSNWANSSPPSTIQGGPESVSLSRTQPVVGTHGMVVSDDREASAWGAEILRNGGNAIDAAVATAFALSVTRPHYASIGGGGFLLYCPHPNKQGPVPCQAIDFREKAPKLASHDMYIQNGKLNPSLSRNGALASGIPGVPSGLLTALEKFGSLPRKKVLSRPIELAKKGYLFSPHSESAALSRWENLNDAAKKIFGCKSETTPSLVPCAPGTRIQQPDLAHVLEEISKKGVDGFYQGPVAQKLVQGLRKAGGIITLEDLKAYRSQARTPLLGRFKEAEIVAMPPPSSGGFLILQLLGYMQRAIQEKALPNTFEGPFGTGFGSASTLHVIAHALSLAYADRAQYLGDPDFVKIPIERLLSPTYLDEKWKTFRPQEANLPSAKRPSEETQAASAEPQHTTHFSVIDSDGNAVAITTSVNDNFGSGFVPPGTGVVMNNEMDDFSIQPGASNLFGLVGNEANSVAAEKHPLSSMSPTIVRDSFGNNQIVIGSAGGPRIASSVFLCLLNRLHFGMSLMDAVSAPRIHQQWIPKEVFLERFGFSEDTETLLRKKGYSLQEVSGLAKVHALERDLKGRTQGAADPRGEGAAVAE